MSGVTDDLERVELEMVERFGAKAPHVARELIESAADRQPNIIRTWHDIANVIERLSIKPKAF